MFSYNGTPNYLVPYLIAIIICIIILFIITICGRIFRLFGEKTTCKYCKKPKRKTREWLYKKSDKEEHKITVCERSFCQTSALLSGYLIASQQ